MWVLIRVISYNFGGPKKVKHMCARERERELTGSRVMERRLFIYLFIFIIGSKPSKLCVWVFFFNYYFLNKNVER